MQYAAGFTRIRLDCDANGLRRTVDRYNHGLEYPGAGFRDEFGRTGNREELDQPPWFLLGPMRPFSATTNGAVTVDREFRVLTEDGETIPRLYAAGSIAKGLHLFGHGHNHNWIFTSGRLAGRNAGGR